MGDLCFFRLSVHRRRAEVRRSAEYFRRSAVPSGLCVLSGADYVDEAVTIKHMLVRVTS